MLYPSNAIQDKRWKLVFSLGFNGCHPTLNAEWLCGILTNSSSFPASVACQSRVLRQSRHDEWQLNRKTRATGYFGAISVLHLWHWAIYSTYSTDIDRNKILSRKEDVVFYCYLTISNYMHFGKLHYMKFSLLQSFESLVGTFPPVPMNSWGFQPGSVNAGLSMLNLEMS